MNRKMKAAVDEAKGLVAAIQGDERKLSRLAEQRSAKQWDLARLTFENTRGNAKENAADRVLLSEWAEAVGGLTASSFGDYRRTWARYGAERLVYADGSEALFGDHITVVRGHATEHGVNAKTPGESSVARDRIAGQEAAAAPSKLTREQKREIAREVIHAEPSIVADAIVENTNVATAIAKDKTAREVVADKATEQREREYRNVRGVVPTNNDIKVQAHQATAGMREALGATDPVVACLHAASASIKEAIFLKRELGTKDPEAAAAAIADITKMLAIYKHAEVRITDADLTWLDKIGVTL